MASPPLHKSSPSLHRLPPATFHWLQDIGEDMCDVRGLGTSEKQERIYSLDSAFPIFNLLFSFCFSSAKWADVGGGGVTWLMFCLVFPGLQGMVQMTMIILIIILIINILIIVTCIHSIFVERQREQVPPTYYNKGPDSTDYQWRACVHVNV